MRWIALSSRYDGYCLMRMQVFKKGRKSVAEEEDGRQRGPILDGCIVIVIHVKVMPSFSLVVLLLYLEEVRTARHLKGVCSTKFGRLHFKLLLYQNFRLERGRQKLVGLAKG